MGVEVVAELSTPEGLERAYNSARLLFPTLAPQPFQDSEEEWEAHVAEARRLGYMGRIGHMVKIEITIPWSILRQEWELRNKQLEIERILSRAFPDITYLNHNDDRRVSDTNQ